jgi:hypothetical protein
MCERAKTAAASVRGFGVAVAVAVPEGAGRGWLVPPQPATRSVARTANRLIRGG